jgi:DNA-binding NtrC family response regulator
MAIAMPKPAERNAQSTRRDHPEPGEGFDNRSRPGLILIVGDDALLLRALDRLLRRAGYDIETNEHWGGDPTCIDSAATNSNVALTIVDLPDYRALGLRPKEFPNSTDPEGGKVLWIGSDPRAIDSAWFLVKPFTAEEFLARVATILALTSSAETTSGSPLQHLAI